MKILLLNTLPPYSGAGKYAFELFYQLRKLNKAPKMLYLYYKPLDAKDRADSSILTPKTLKMPFLRQMINEQFYFPKKIPKNYDIYHLTGQGIGLYTKFIKKPSIITVHDIIPFIYRQGIRSFLSRRSIKYCRYAKIIIADSEHTKKDLIKYLKIAPNKIKVIYLGVNHKVFRPLKIKSSISKQIMLHVGTEEPRKNIALIISSFYELRKKFKNLHLIRVGNPSKPIARLIKRLNLSKYVKYMICSTEEQLANIYNIADVFVFPSTYEGFGLPPLEAMACGCPVISSNKTSLPEIVGNSALVIEPNKQNLCRAVSKVLTDKKLRKELIRKGLKQAKKFTWEKCAKETLKVYQKVYTQK